MTAVQNESILERAVPADLMQVGGEEIVRVNMNIPRSQRDVWKMEAVRRRMTLTDMIAVAMSQYLAK